jgi:hypothetical protein
MSIEAVIHAFHEKVRLEFEIGPFASDPRHEYRFHPSYRLNAYAMRGESGAPAYVFNDGCGFAISDIFMSLMAEQDFFDGVPLDRDSIVRGPDMPGRFSDYSWLQSMRRDAFLPPMQMTTDRARFGLGDHLFECAVRFLVLHEIQHYAQGHLHLLHSTDGSLGFGEIPDASIRAIPTRLRRALELDADGHAASVLFHVGRHENARKVAHFRGMTEAVWDCTLLVAIGVVFMLIDLAESRAVGADEERTHPTAAARTIDLLAFYQSMRNYDWDALTRMFFVVLHELAIASRLIGVLPMTSDDFTSMAIIGAETSAVREWLELRREIESQQTLLKPHRDLAYATFGFATRPMPSEDAENAAAARDIAVVVPQTFIEMSRMLSRKTLAAACSPSAPRGWGAKLGSWVNRQWRR